MKVWKVCMTNSKGEFISCVADKKWELTYCLGKPTKAEIGKVFCFSTLKDALDYTWTDDVLTVLECEAHGTQKIDEGQRYSRIVDDNSWECYWENVNKGFFNIPGAEIDFAFFPFGTVFCDEIIPKKVVGTYKYGTRL